MAFSAQTSTSSLPISRQPHPTSPLQHSDLKNLSSSSAIVPSSPLPASSPNTTSPSSTAITATSATSTVASAAFTPSPTSHSILAFPDSAFQSHHLLLSQSSNRSNQFLAADRLVSSPTVSGTLSTSGPPRISPVVDNRSSIMVDPALVKSPHGFYEGTPSQKAQMLEHKRQEHEFMRQEHIRRFEQEMHLLAEQHRKDEQMILQMAANEADNSANTATTISEPTTPPDYREALPSTTVGGDRIRSQTVPVGVAGVVTPNAMLRLPGQQLMTPPEDAIPRTRTLTSTSLGPSRRLSNEDPLLFDLPKLSLGRSDSQARSQSAVDVDSTYSLGQINTTKFLFGDDSASGSSSATAVNPELKFNTTDDKFPILIRRESFNQSSLSQPASSQVLSTSAQQQPATSQPGTQQQVWPFMSRGRSGHQHTLSGVSAAYGDSVNHYKDKRASVDMPSTYHLFNGGTNSSKSFPNDVSHSRQPSQRSISDSERHEQSFQPSGSPLPGLHADGISPVPSPGVYPPYMLPQVFHPSTYSYPPLYRANQQPAPDKMYGQGIASGPPVAQAHPHQHQHSPSQPNVAPPSGANLMHRTASNRRQSEQDVNRFANVMLESLVNEIYSLCKDQHGCRYLQKKLEERNPTYLNMIFNETYPHVVELMIDPFGNYLCQKLLEHANDEQRTILVETAAPQLVKIALNQHGTRALQKMIEHVSTPEQIRLIVNALKTNVVELIQDLNGNHVIQKCLNRLSTDDAQFIFDAVSENCVAVGTHRHGCCVLQRCIDHASDAQKQQLVNEITTHAFTLVQDPFGNYVTQYVLDLCDAKYSDPLIRRFSGNVCTLSMQKFSSNVIEKCIRIAEPSTRKILIDELLSSVFLEKLLRDSFANYVIQTALDYADPQTRQVLVDVIRPILPSIRNTPYGRRIQSKIIGPPVGAAAGSPNGNASSSPFQGYPRGNGNGNAGSNMLVRRMQGLEIQDSNIMHAVNGSTGSAYGASSSGQQSQHQPGQQQNSPHPTQPQAQNGQHHLRQQSHQHQGHPQYFSQPFVQQPMRNAFTNGDFSGYNYM